MTAVISIDKSGRLVLPKAMRDALHLAPGSRLTAEIVGGKIELAQEPCGTRIVKRGNRRVITGWTGFDAATAVREMRADQIARLEAPFGK